MSKMIMYIDSSEQCKGSTVHQGWGIVAMHADRTVELSGVSISRCRDRRENRGYYELLAFMEAVLYAESHGYVPEETSFYTDCDWVAYSGFYLVPENYTGFAANNIRSRIESFQKAFYPDNKSVIEKMATWLVNARIHWVRGHRYFVHNCRADHLARGVTLGETVQPFEEWLATGVQYWNPAFGKKMPLPFPFMPDIAIEEVPCVN